MSGFLLLGLVSSVIDGKNIGKVIFLCVEWDVRLHLSQSISDCDDGVW